MVWAVKETQSVCLSADAGHELDLTPALERWSGQLRTGQDRLGQVRSDVL